MPNLKRNQKRRSYMPKKKPFNMFQSNMKFYNSKAWRVTRKIYIEQNPLCEDCLGRGLTEGAQVVDHVVEINDGGAKLNQNNLRSLCHPCHNSKSGKRGAKKTNSEK